MKTELKTRIENENGIYSFIIFDGSISNEIAKWYSMPNETLGAFMVRIAAEVDNVTNIHTKLDQLQTKEPKVNTEPVKTELSNENCFFNFNFEKKEISGGDLTDRYNDPRCYNKTVRGFKKAIQELQNHWHDNITMYGAMEILSSNGIRMRSYCAMD